MQTSETEITYRVWVRRGGMLVNTNALDPDDPDHVYNQIKSQGVDPEDYGVFDPYEDEFKDWSVHDLKKEILSLRKELVSLYKHLAGC